MDVQISLNFAEATHCFCLCIMKNCIFQENKLLKKITLSTILYNECFKLRKAPIISAFLDNQASRITIPFIYYIEITNFNTVKWDFNYTVSSYSEACKTMNSQWKWFNTESEFLACHFSFRKRQDFTSASKSWWGNKMYISRQTNHNTHVQKMCRGWENKSELYSADLKSEKRVMRQGRGVKR